MKKSKNINTKFKFLIIFLLVILFPNNIYSMQKKEKIPYEVIVGGELLQINMDTSKLMVYMKDDTISKLKNYDLVMSLEGDAIYRCFNKKVLKNVERKDILEIILNMKKNEKIKVIVLRDNNEKILYLNKKEINHSYFTDKIPFSASLTYINPKDGSFGAVAHYIDVYDNENILSKKGDIYLCNLFEIKKSNKEQVGNMYGEKIYCSQGKIENISEFGAKGNIKGDEILKNSDIYTVGKSEDVKVGTAHLLIQDYENKNKKSYEINITKVNKQKKPETQGFEFEIVDKKLIENYGGIVQGMSGCPIIQNGKIIGALSHVISRNTSKGVGLYIEWMMED